MKVTKDMLPHPLPGIDHQMLNVGLHVNPQEVMYLLQRTLSKPAAETYYLSKDRIKAGDSPFDEYTDLIERDGEEKPNSS